MTLPAMAEVVQIHPLASQKVVTPREPFWVAMRFEIQDGWHIYAPTPAKDDKGFDIKGLVHSWTLPAGVRILESHWSLQKDVKQSGFTLSVFDHEAWLFTKMISDHDLDASHPFSVHFDWAACQGMCTLGQKTVNFSFPFTEQSLIESSVMEKHIQGFQVENVLEHKMFFLWAFVLAFLGGIILNLMPCVLPVLSMKILHLVQYQRHVKLHGWLFTLGVWLCFMTLAAFLFILRYTGHDVGWGFQLQAPLFVAFLSLVFSLLALNMLGIFDFGHLVTVQGAPKNPYLSTFVNGALTCLVATPCTAPFMGAALGAAIVYPWYVGLFIFSGLAWGVAFPFLALCLWPKALNFLPKPGAWMVTLKQFFSFSLWASALWFAWIFGHQTSLNEAFILILLILFISLCAWGWGRLGQSSFKILVLVLGVVGTAAGFYNLHVQADSQENLIWEPYSESLLDRLKNEGRTVFVDFTAKWCITCQLNKSRVLETPDVVDLLQKKKVALLRADWTKKDPAITKALEQQGRNSIPLYIVYKGTQSATLLPEILTVQDIQKALG